MPRDEKGRFTKEENGFSLTLPSPFSILKYLFTVYFGGVSSSGGFPPPCHFIS